MKYLIVHIYKFHVFTINLNFANKILNNLTCNKIPWWDWGLFVCYNRLEKFESNNIASYVHIS